MAAFYYLFYLSNCLEVLVYFLKALLFFQAQIFRSQALIDVVYFHSALLILDGY